MAQTPYDEEKQMNEREVRVYVAKRLTERRKEKKEEDPNKGMICYFTLGKEDDILCFYSVDGKWTSRSVDTYLDEEDTSDNIYWCDGIKVWRRFKFKAIFFLQKISSTDKKRNIISVRHGKEIKKYTRFAIIDVDAIR